ncbi:MAG TPA: hypothetical protein VKA08_17175 [Balneolales bacterium]|nr:hypothetical protein [Balneolales bacterium]
MKKIWWTLWIICFLIVPSVEAQILPPAKHDTASVYHHSREFHYKNSQKAFWLSFGHTVIPVLTGTIILEQTSINDSKLLRISGGALIVYGMIVGPSIGLFYAGSDEKASGGILGRIAATALVTVGAYWDLYVGLGNAFDYSGSDQTSETIPLAVFYSGVILLTGSAALQIIKAPAEARKHNRMAHLSIAPTWYPREKAPGLAINIHF